MTSRYHVLPLLLIIIIIIITLLTQQAGSGSIGATKKEKQGKAVGGKDQGKADSNKTLDVPSGNPHGAGLIGAPGPIIQIPQGTGLDGDPQQGSLNPQGVGEGSGNPPIIGEGSGNAQESVQDSENPQSAGLSSGNSQGFGQGSENPKGPGQSPGNPHDAGQDSGNPQDAGQDSGNPQSAGQGSGNPQGAGQDSGNTQGVGQGSRNPQGAGQGSGNPQGVGQGSGNPQGAGQGSGNPQGAGQGSGNPQGAGQDSGQNGAPGKSSGNSQGPRLITAPGQSKNKSRSVRGPALPGKGVGLGKGNGKEKDRPTRPPLPPGLTDKESRQYRGMKKKVYVSVSQNVMIMKKLAAKMRGIELSDEDVGGVNSSFIGDIQPTLSQSESWKQDMEEKARGKGLALGLERGQKQGQKRPQAQQDQTDTQTQEQTQTDTQTHGEEATDMQTQAPEQMGTQADSLQGGEGGRGQGRGQGRGRGKRVKRKLPDFQLQPDLRFDVSEPIFYTYDTSDEGFSPVAEEIVLTALNVWSSVTCIVFEPFTPVTDPQAQVLHFRFNLSEISWSYIGKTDESTEQVININYGDPRRHNSVGMLGTAIHEIGHALGLVHEQTRPDRDLHLTVDFDNIDPKYYTQYLIQPGLQMHGVPYAFTSVMHYPAFSTFATNMEVPVLIPSNMLFLNTIGQRSELDFYDAQVINLEYCYDRCPTLITCDGGGYQDPNDCTRCICPPTRSGLYCSDLAPSRQGSCLPSNSKLIVSNTQYEDALFLSSSDFATYFDYQKDDACIFELKAPEGCQIELKFDLSFSLYCYSKICYHFLEILLDGHFVDSGPRFCCSGVHWNDFSEFLTSDSNIVIVNFDARYKGSPFEDITYIPGGWKLWYKIANPSCLSTTSASTQSSTIVTTTEYQTTESNTQSPTTQSPTPSPTTLSSTPSPTTQSPTTLSSTPSPTTQSPTSPQTESPETHSTTESPTSQTTSASTETETTSQFTTTQSSVQSTSASSPSQDEVRDCFISKGLEQEVPDFQGQCPLVQSATDCASVTKYKTTTCTFNGVEEYWSAVWALKCVQYVKAGTMAFGLPEEDITICDNFPNVDPVLQGFEPSPENEIQKYVGTY